MRTSNFKHGQNDAWIQWIHGPFGSRNNLLQDKGVRAMQLPQHYLRGCDSNIVAERPTVTGLAAALASKPLSFKDDAINSRRRHSLARVSLGETSFPFLPSERHCARESWNLKLSILLFLLGRTREMLPRISRKHPSRDAMFRWQDIKK